MLYKKVNQRSLLLMSCALDRFSLEEVNNRLDDRLMRPINNLDWNVWLNFYIPLAQGNILYEQELLYNNRDLSWFANDLKKRHNKKTIS